MLVLKTGRRGRFIYFHHKNIYQYSDWSSLLRCYDYLTIREKGWKLTSSLYHSQGSLHIICSPNTFVQRPLRQYRKSTGKTMVFSLIILVTGNRKMGGMAGLMPQPYVSVCLFDHTTMWPQASLFPKGRIQGGRVFCPVFRDPPSAGTWCSRDGRIAPSPLREAGRAPEGHAAGPPTGDVGQCARCFLFLCFLSFFLLAHLGQNHCISSGGAAINPTQGQWYQSSQSSHPIMGLPSSGLSHPGQIQIWFPHSSRIT